MAKILLVEDDVNLREIYSARFAAESYQVITASDGEEALATAVRERPDLIVLDVMMPKISGFDVLDILRSTPETKETKVIMMTALSQESDRQRGESLGANKYLIKSQVTLEDVVNSVKEQLSGGGTANTPPPPKPPAPPAQPAPPAPPAAQ
jgi:two-component system phosphate regulon response regulator PhoB